MSIPPHECTPPTLVILQPDGGWHITRAAGEKWRCPACRRVWTVTLRAGLRIGGREVTGPAWKRPRWRNRIFG